MYVNALTEAPMARRTKADAQRTRERILDKAEREFQRRGVSRTSLQQVALAAGVTRGAIYWHFRNKADLFNAMMNRVTLPLESEILRSGERDIEDPLAQIRQSFLAALRATARDAQAQRVFEIALFKVEHGVPMRSVRQRRLKGLQARLRQMQRGFRRASPARQRAAGVSARTAAIGLHSLVDGLIANWLLDPTAFDLEQVGRQVIDIYLRGLQ